MCYPVFLLEANGHHSGRAMMTVHIKRGKRFARLVPRKCSVDIEEARTVCLKCAPLFAATILAPQTFRLAVYLPVAELRKKHLLPCDESFLGP